MNEKKGTWIRQNNYNYHCSECEGEPYFSGSIYEYRYCPYCGAKMTNENVEELKKEFMKLVRPLIAFISDLQTNEKIALLDELKKENMEGE